MNTNESQDVASRTTRCPGRRGRATAQRGAALVETAITIMVFVTMIVGMIDFGTLVLRQHALSQAARQLARRAVVHGSLATELGSWGPASVTTTASDPSVIGTTVRNSLVLVDPNSVNVRVDWIDGGNSVQIHNRVRVTLTAPVQLIVAWTFGNRTYNLRASSTMPIAH